VTFSTACPAAKPARHRTPHQTRHPLRPVQQLKPRSIQDLNVHLLQPHTRVHAHQLLASLVAHGFGRTDATRRRSKAPRPTALFNLALVWMFVDATLAFARALRRRSGCAKSRGPMRDHDLTARHRVTMSSVRVAPRRPGGKPWRLGPEPVGPKPGRCRAAKACLLGSEAVLGHRGCVLSRRGNRGARHIPRRRS
jgi:hypothetical protein